MTDRDAFLARLKHDLLKRALWAARDLEASGKPPRPDDLRALERGLGEVTASDGRRCAAGTLWQTMRVDACEWGAAPAALDAFGTAVAAAERAVRGLAARPAEWRAAVRDVLALEPAFAALAKALRERLE